MRYALAVLLLLAGLSGCGLAETGATAAGGAAAAAQQAARARLDEQRVRDQIDAANRVAEQQRRAAEAQAQ
ncbi:MAG: hypothetical protein PVSMB6_16690 [Steroidobacteraceae bacterium]